MSTAPPEHADDLTPLGLKRCELATLREHGNVRPAFYLLCVLGGLAAAIMLYARFRHPVAWVACMVLVGALQHHLWIIQREAMHYLLFPDRRINDTAGNVVAAMLLLSTGSRWDSWHEQSVEHAPPFNFMRDVVLRLTGLPALYRIFSSIARGRPGGELRRLAITQAVLLVACIVLGHLSDYLWLWIVPLLTVAETLRHCRSLVEHAPTERRLRTVRCSRLEAFFFAPMNVNFQAERRLCAGVPYHRLPHCHKLLSEQPGYDDEVDVEDGYVRFLFRGAVDKAA
jgi:fatty acid desaturase